jgi:hypothetical protein
MLWAEELKGDHAAYRTRKKGEWKGLNRKKQKRTKQREGQVTCDERALEKLIIVRVRGGKLD